MDQLSCASLSLAPSSSSPRLRLGIVTPAPPPPVGQGRRSIGGGGGEEVLEHMRGKTKCTNFVGVGRDGGSTRKRISPPLSKIQLYADPHWGPALPSRRKKCKLRQPSSRTAFVITVSTQPGMLPHHSPRSLTSFTVWCHPAPAAPPPPAPPGPCPFLTP